MSHNFGTACGAMIEVFDTPEAAEARRDYVAKVLKSMPMLDKEYQHLKGGALLRIDGKVKPSVAKKYEAAFE